MKKEINFDFGIDNDNTLINDILQHHSLEEKTPTTTKTKVLNSSCSSSGIKRSIQQEDYSQLQQKRIELQQQGPNAILSSPIKKMKRSTEYIIF